jgi:DNA repair protein RAD7
LDEPDEETPTTKRRKLTKAAEEKLKAKEKAKAKKKGKKVDDNDNEGEDDMYTALSKSTWGGAASIKPPVGNFEKCAKCEKEFTVVRHWEFNYAFPS